MQGDIARKVSLAGGGFFLPLKNFDLDFIAEVQIEKVENSTDVSVVGRIVESAASFLSCRESFLVEKFSRGQGTGDTLQKWSMGEKFKTFRLFQ